MPLHQRHCPIERNAYTSSPSKAGSRSTDTTRSFPVHRRLQNEKRSRFPLRLLGGARQPPAAISPPPEASALLLLNALLTCCLPSLSFPLIGNKQSTKSLTVLLEIPLFCDWMLVNSPSYRIALAPTSLLARTPARFFCFQYRRVRFHMHLLRWPAIRANLIAIRS